MLTVEEIQRLLELISEKYGFGYSNEPGVGALQAKLSIMQEMAAKRESVPSVANVKSVKLG